jgi:hypothetical protein
MPRLSGRWLVKCASQFRLKVANCKACSRFVWLSTVECEVGGCGITKGMAIKKQEFYEGAALHLLARAGNVRSIQYDAPFFLLNGHLLVLLKHCTRARSPWGFTFTADEQSILDYRASEFEIVLGLVCGADGVAAFSYDAYLKVASLRRSAIHIACYRRHGEYYEVAGPDGKLPSKVPPSKWQTILRS